MKLEQQVTSLELSKKLKEMGVRQESLWYQYTRPQGFEGIVRAVERYKGEYTVAVGDFNKEYTMYVFNGVTQGQLVSRFTVAELGEILKQYKNIRYYYNPLMGNSSYWIIQDISKEEQPYEFASTEADARAKMLIYLIDNKLILI